MMKDVMVCGGGIAGATTAWWLRHHGFQPVVVELAPAPRWGGQAVDVRGAALAVTDRMGLTTSLRAAQTDMRGMSVVAPDGTELLRSTDVTLTGGPVGGHDVEILRDDLAAILLGACEGMDTVFGDSPRSLTPHAAGVDVALASGTTRTFDLVVGADGQHSAVRRLAFGPDDDGRLMPLGQHVAIFTAPNTFGLDRWQVFLQREDAMVGVYTARDNAEVRVVMGFTDADADYDHRDVAAQQELVRSHFAADGWWVPQFLEAMGRSQDFLLTPTTQVRMPHWSDGRVALVGDSAYCATLLSGQGTSLALVGGYVLAGELARAGGDHGAGFAAYEHRMRDFVAVNQQLALTNAERVRDLARGGAESATSGIEEHWVATAATAIDLPDY